MLQVSVVTIGDCSTIGLALFKVVKNRFLPGFEGPLAKSVGGPAVTAEARKMIRHSVCTVPLNAN